MTSGRPAVFLDRDGVLTRSLFLDGKGYAPLTLENFRLLPGAAKSVARLKAAGFLVVVVTNQPDIGNGLVSSAIVGRMHDRLLARTRVDDIEMCAHGQSENCNCRKPKPGMLYAAARKHGIDLRLSYMVGDRASDVAAGQAVGCRSVFIDRSYSEPRPTRQSATVRSLSAAVDFILSQSA